MSLRAGDAFFNAKQDSPSAVQCQSLYGRRTRGRIEMALYEYKCAECEERFDLMRPMSAADDPAQCPECGSEDSRRVISNFASITPGASTLSTNPVMDARMSGGGCCGGGCGCG
jgi:putative FmdB family regulatory protein